MKKTSISALLVLSMVSILFSVSGQASANTNKQYLVPKVSTKIKPNGILDEEVWQKALVLELNYEVQPGENNVPS